MKTQRYLTQHDAAILSKLAERLLRMREIKINAGESLIDLLTTAILLPENVRKENHVSLGTEVTYCKLEQDGRPAEKAPERHSVVIVSPQDADRTLARVSVLAPLAMAMLGRKVGSIVEVQLPFDKVEFVRILDVKPLSPVGSEAAANEREDEVTA